MKTLIVLLSALLSTLSSIALRADEVVIDNGDRLTGVVLRMDGGVLEIETAYAGVVSIDWATVRELSTDDPMRLRLEDGTLVSGWKLSRGAQGFLLDVAGDTGGKAVSVAGINLSDWELGEGYRLTGQVDLALKADRGNSDKDEIDISASLEWQRLQHRVKLFGEFEYDMNDGEQTKNKWQLSTKYDKFVSEQRYYGIGVFLEQDDLAGLDLRSSMGPYIGHQFFKGNTTNLSAEIGVNYVFESFTTDTDNDYMAAAWTVDFDYFVMPSILQFYHRQIGLTKLEAPGDFIIDTWTGLRFPLRGGFSTSAEVKADYDANAAPGADKWDTTYRLKLGRQW